MNNIKHISFVNNLKSLLQEDLNNNSEENNEGTSEDEIVKELQKKFDELFGPLDDEDD